MDWLSYQLKWSDMLGLSWLMLKIDSHLLILGLNQKKLAMQLMQRGKVVLHHKIAWTFIPFSMLTSVINRHRLVEQEGYRRLAQCNWWHRPQPGTDFSGSVVGSGDNHLPEPKTGRPYGFYCVHHSTDGRCWFEEILVVIPPCHLTKSYWQALPPERGSKIHAAHLQHKNLCHKNHT